MPLAPRVVDHVQEFVVFQQFIHGPHPGFPQFGYFFGKQTFPNGWLRVTQLDHCALLCCL